MGSVLWEVWVPGTWGAVVVVLEEREGEVGCSEGLGRTGFRPGQKSGSLRSPPPI